MTSSAPKDHEARRCAANDTPVAVNAPGQPVGPALGLGLALREWTSTRSGQSTTGGHHA